MPLGGRRIERGGLRRVRSGLSREGEEEVHGAGDAGVFAARRFQDRRVVPHIGSRCVGAVLASGVLRAMFPSDQALGATLPSGDAAIRSFVLEVVLTTILMFAILGVSAGSRAKGVSAGVAVGSVIALEALFAGPVSGASTNPARSFALALVAWRLEYFWVHLTAPVVGAIAGVLACRCV